MTHKTQVNIRIPEIENLCCINCKVNPVDMQDPLVKSLFHCQILTCRLIIYTMRCCIASPSIQNADDLVHVIINKSFYNSGKFQEHLSKLKIQYTEPEPVHPKIYEACLKYTFTFRLAPHWNSVGKSFYLQGFNFLSLTSNINAMEWNILFKNGNDIKLELIPSRMNLFPLTLDSLSLPPKTVDGFILNSKINSIDLTSFENSWVYVLPKLTKARIVSVSKILPESCPFDNYNDLRRHWKNMYSYRLPKSNEGLLFYEVIFPIEPNQYFTYPETCILSRMPELLMCDNKNEVASQFLKDLSDNVHSVCGEVIQICHLYPELDIEYSCILRQNSEICSKENIEFLKSSYFKTPTEFTMKPPNEKVDLSSLFTFKGMDKMRPTMKEHSQKVLSIMQNKKRKKKSIKQDNNEYLTQSIFDKKKPKFGASNLNQYFPNEPLIPHQKTIVTNLDDIISYYDIPSMCSEEIEIERSILEEYVKQNMVKSESAHSIHQTNRPQPLIKNIEKVCFDLKNIKDLKIDHILQSSTEQKTMNNEVNESHTNFLSKRIKNTAHSISNSLNATENEVISQNLVPDEFEKKSQKSLSSNYDCVSHQLQSSLHSVDLNDKLISDNKPQQTSNENLDALEMQSYDQKIRSFLSSFDLYNIYNHNEVDMETKIYEHYKKSSAKLDVNNEVPAETFMVKSPRTSFEKEKFSDNNLSNLNFEKNLNKCPNKSLENSPSILIAKKSHSIDISHVYSESGLKCYDTPAPVPFSTDPKNIFEHQSSENKLLETPIISKFSYDIFEESVNRNLLHKSISPIDKNILKSKAIDTQNLENSKVEDIDRFDKEAQNFLFINKPMDNSNVLTTFDNALQYSADMFQSNNEIQDKNTSQYKKEIHEFMEQSDFLSILSESSNESGTDDYESCKQVFKEALTLNK